MTLKLNSKRFILFLLVVFSIISQSMAQKISLEDLKTRLKEYNVPPDFLEHAVRNANGLYAFDFKMINGSEDGTPVESMVCYDPNRQKSKRWQLESVNDRKPTKKEVKNFNRINNARGEEVDAQIDSETVNILVDSDKYFSFSFRFVEGSLDPKHSYLEDCEGEIYIQKKTGNIEAVRFENFRETKVRMLKCDKLQVEYELQYMEETEMYVLKKEMIDIRANFMGREVQLGDTGEYINYQRIK